MTRTTNVKDFIDFVTNENVVITDLHDNEVDLHLFKLKDDLEGKYIIDLNYTIINQNIAFLKATQLIKESMGSTDYEIYDIKCYEEESVSKCTFYIKIAFEKNSPLNLALLEKKTLKTLQWNMLYNNPALPLYKGVLSIVNEDDFIGFISRDNVGITEMKCYGDNLQSLSSIKGSILLNVTYHFCNPTCLSFEEHIQIEDFLLNSCEHINAFLRSNFFCFNFFFFHYHINSFSFESAIGLLCTFFMHIRINTDTKLFKLLCENSIFNKAWDKYIPTVAEDITHVSDATLILPVIIETVVPPVEEVVPPVETVVPLVEEVVIPPVEERKIRINRMSEFIDFLKSPNVEVKEWSFISKVNPIINGISILSDKEDEYYKHLSDCKRELYSPDFLLFNFDYTLTGDDTKLKFSFMMNNCEDNIYIGKGRQYIDEGVWKLIIPIHIKIESTSAVFKFLRDNEYLSKYYPSLYRNKLKDTIKPKDIFLFGNVKIDTIRDFRNFLNAKNVILKEWEFISDIGNVDHDDKFLYHSLSNGEYNFYKYLTDIGKPADIPNNLFFNCEYIIPSDLDYSLNKIIVINSSLSENYAVIKHESYFTTKDTYEKSCSLRINVAKDSVLYKALFEHGYITKFYPKFL